LLAFVYGDESYEPSVAFICNLPARYSMEHGKDWVKDDSTGCLKDPVEILNYCKKVFPTLDVRNVVEGSQKVTIDNWCDFGTTKCDKQFVVTPYRCLVGPFQSDALLVPEHCVFDHVHNSKLCTSFAEWNKTAHQACTDRSMVQQSFAMLQPCGIDKFNGVEFVCCPVKADNEVKNIRDEALPAKKPSGALPPRRLPPQRMVPGGRKVQVQPDPQQSYPQRENVEGRGQEKGHRWNEHEYYMKAKGDMQRHHHDKITKMMKDWANARQRVQEMKTKDPKGSERLNKEITNRFQKMYQAEEMEGEMEKKQLSTLHQQRVQAELSERKQRALDQYVETVDDDSSDSGEILKALKQYVKALQKDRLHTVNRFKHLEEIDPEEALTTRRQTADHLRVIDQHLSDALTMLDRLPRIKNKIMQEIQDYLDSYHSIDRTVAIILAEEPAAVEKKKEPANTTPVHSHDVVEDDERVENSEDDDDDEKDKEEDWTVKKVEEPKSDVKEDEDDNDDDDDDDEDEDDEEFDEDEEEEEEVESDSDEDSEDERIKTTHTTTTSTTTSTKPTRRPSIKSPLVKVKSINSAPVVKTKPVHGEEKKVEDRGDVIAVDYMNPKGAAAPKPWAKISANVANNGMHQEQLAYIHKDPVHTGSSPAVPLGIAVGGLTVFIVIVVGVVTMRRRQRRAGQRPLRPLGSLDLDQTAGSPEERHVASMQMNGYENPTYKYFEQGASA